MKVKTPLGRPHSGCQRRPPGPQLDFTGGPEPGHRARVLPDSQPSETEMINVRCPELLSLRQFVLQSPIAHLYSRKDEMLWPELGHFGWEWGVWMEQTGGPGQGLG